MVIGCLTPIHHYITKPIIKLLWVNYDLPHRECYSQLFCWVTTWQYHLWQRMQHSASKSFHPEIKKAKIRQCTFVYIMTHFFVFFFIFLYSFYSDMPKLMQLFVTLVTSDRNVLTINFYFCQYKIPGIFSMGGT